MLMPRDSMVWAAQSMAATASVTMARFVPVCVALVAMTLPAGSLRPILQIVQDTSESVSCNWRLTSSEGCPRLSPTSARRDGCGYSSSRP